MKGSSKLLVRAATTDITPPTPLPLFGRAGRKESATKVVSRLEANCVLFGEQERAAAIVSIDSLYPSKVLADEVQRILAERGLAFRPQDLLIIASHTHNAPALDATKPGLGCCDDGYLRFAAARIADGVAMANAAPAQAISLCHGQALCEASLFRRRTLHGFDMARWRITLQTVMAPNAGVKIDQALRLFVFAGENGRPQAVIWSWPCHAVSEPESGAVSADFPGVLRDHIRRTYGDTTLPVLFFPGFSGDIRPASYGLFPVHKAGKWFGVGSRFARNTPKRARALHDSLRHSFDEAKAKLRALGTISGSALTKTQAHLEVTEIRCQTGTTAPLTCDTWSIGPVKIVAVSAEVASHYTAVAGGLDPLTLMTGCAGQVFGYLPADHQIDEGGYEVNGFAALFPVPGTFQGTIEPQITRLMQQ